MAQQPALVSMAEQFSGLPMEDLIGAPLMAAAKANSDMGAAQVDFLLKTCFAYDKEADTYTPTMIKMILKRGVLVPVDPTADPPVDPEIKVVETEFDLPILTILPLNSLAVDEVNISFKMEVQSSFSETDSDERTEALAAEASWSAKVGYGPFSAKVKGSVSYNSESTTSHETYYEKSNSAEYNVTVHAGQLPLPKGVNTIIEAFTKAIEPVTMPVFVGDSGG